MASVYEEEDERLHALLEERSKRIAALEAQALVTDKHVKALEDCLRVAVNDDWPTLESYVAWLEKAKVLADPHMLTDEEYDKLGIA
jgi:hypothetical protein